MNYKGKIFLLEDEKKFQDDISNELEKLNYAFDMHDGERIIKSQTPRQISYKPTRPIDIIIKYPYNLAILDMEVKEDLQGGLTLLRDIRKYNQTIPIIMTSEYISQKRTEEALSLVIYDLILKRPSFDLGRLTRKVDEIVMHKTEKLIFQEKIRKLFK